MDNKNFDGQNLFGSNGFQIMGMMNALKTGDMHTDMVVAMCIPFVLRLLFTWMKKFEKFLDFEAWMEWFFRQPIPEEEHKRFITYSTTRNSWGHQSNLDYDSENWVLHKAIKLYVHHVLQLKLKTAHLNLMEGEFGKDKDDDGDDDLPKRTLFGILCRYNVVNTVPSDEWQNLGYYGDQEKSLVRLCIETNQKKEGEDDKNKSETINKITFQFRSKGEGAIEAFVDCAYKWYLEELRKQEDHSRYLYEMKVPELVLGSGGEEGRSGSSTNIRYKRYKLSNEKTFDSLFFRQKENLLNIVDHFNAKTGKYAVSGYPYKLGILLHGPPGTGKTSLIKALAHYTGRSIVNVPLSCVSTNSELMSIFLDKKYHVEGTDVPTQLRFKDVIFVMEDVDAASRIVKSRSGRPNNDAEFNGVQGEEEDPLEFPKPKSLWQMLVESEANICQQLVRQLSGKSEKLKKEANKPEYLRSACKRISSFPGLGLVGETGIDAKTSILCKEAIASAEGLIGQHTKLDNILAAHAKTIKRMIDNGTEVDDMFVDDLLRDIQSMSDVVRVGDSESSFSLTDSSVSQSSPRGPMELEEELNNNNTATSGESGNGGAVGPERPSSWWGKLNPDQLSLSGLLNVLDGVVDTPGRILIMTTNHPEMLDPALIRPGRIDKKIMLGYMAASDVMQMLEHCFQSKLTDDQKGRIGKIFNGCGKSAHGMTPAQVEQLAAEHDTLDEMIDSLSNKF